MNKILLYTLISTIGLLLYTVHVTANPSNIEQKKNLIKRLVELQYNTAEIASITDLTEEQVNHLQEAIKEKQQEAEETEQKLLETIEAERKHLKVEEAERKRLEVLSITNEDLLSRSNYRITGYQNFNTEGIDKTLADECSNCANRILSSLVMFGTHEQYSSFHNKIQENSTDCLRNIILNISDDLETRRIPVQCTKEEYKINKDCKKIFADLEAKEKRVTDLLTLMQKRSGINQTEAGTVCILCEDGDSNSRGYLNLKAFDQIVTELDEHIQCGEMTSGNTRRVEGVLSSRYSLTKTNDETYTVPLYLSFEPINNYDGLVPADQVNSYYLNKAQECLSQAQEKLLGPNGEKLNIVTHAPQQNKCSRKTPGTHNIRIGSKHLRSSNQVYASDINCSTITHEVLHLLGLTDEYKEQSLGYYVNPHTGQTVTEAEANTNKDTIFQSAYDCRVVQLNNIMSDDDSAWSDKIENDKEGSLLTPGQFQAILYGDCEQNKFFKECSELAYESSIDTPECLETKRQCEEQNGLGHNKQAQIKALEDELEKYNQQIIQARKNIEIYQTWISKDTSVRITVSINGRQLTEEERVPQVRNLIAGENKRIEGYNQEIESLEESLQKIRAWPD